MPNRGEHIETGAWTGLVLASLVNVIEQGQRKKSNPYHKFNWGELIGNAAFGTGLGALGGVLPDMLEPPTHPGHRDLFHSVATGAAICYGLNKINNNAKATSQGKTFLNTLGVGYLSHLVLDGQTPSGLPFLTKR